MFEREELAIRGAFVLHGKNFKDERGEFHKSVHKGLFEKMGLEWSFDEQFYTVSNKNVVHNMHIQLPPHDHIKLVYCVHGSVLDVLVDLRTGSPSFGQALGLNLDHESANSVYIPKGVAHGFRALSDQAILMYSVTACHAPNADTGVRWDSISFDWQITKPIVSERDKTLLPLTDFNSPFVME